MAQAVLPASIALNAATYVSPPLQAPNGCVREWLTGRFMPARSVQRMSALGRVRPTIPAIRLPQTSH